MKGADVVMSNIVQYNDWLEEEVKEKGRKLDILKRLKARISYMTILYLSVAFSVAIWDAKVFVLLSLLRKY